MKVRTDWGDDEYEIDLGAGHTLSVRLEFEGAQPNAFGIDRATKEPYRVGDWVGDTRQGGSVNCFVVTLCPHGNGTHTECVGHIVDERIAIADVLDDPLIPAWVVTSDVVTLGGTDEAYDAAGDPDDTVVCRQYLEVALRSCPDFVKALVIRTRPNPADKAHSNFSGRNPTFLTSDAMRLIHERGFEHLLVDFPSVDREDDGGTLPNHRIYWDVAPGSRSTAGSASARTITEMVYVADAIADGLWVLSLEVPDFALDAAPSRVRIFPITVSQQKQ